ncbi:hypothetical protein COU61_05015 [Candidatus Pacearchaeota archaeon CG10_big_fil_rev_8_21_14_0_10_35_13]|nr:MAG: hypothetical protein COU61_05015 [Candidatus Pacearchaeota archaeon CG10_big_fil_rev_8_21_14_0_10_35_13]
MVKRNKKLKKAIESYKEEIGKHFKKLEKDLDEGDETTARYHVKEIDKSLIAGMENKMKMLGELEEDIEIVNKYKKLLEEYKKKLGINE